MANTPRYVGFLDPPYVVTLTDDSNSPLNLSGCTPSSFSLTMVLLDQTGHPISSKAGAGTWTTPADATGKATYQYAAADVSAAGNWLLYTTVKLPAEPGPREFDPDQL